MLNLWSRGTARACRFRLSFHAASDSGIFPPEVLAARRQREAESLADWERTAAAFAGLAGFHAWLHDQHLCYAVRRQVRCQHAELLTMGNHEQHAEADRARVPYRRSLAAVRLASQRKRWPPTECKPSMCSEDDSLQGFADARRAFESRCERRELP